MEEQKDILEVTEIDLLDELDEVDKAIIRYKLEGHNSNDIAKKIDKHRQTINKRLKKVKVQQAINELQKTALQILLDGQSEAARALKTIVKTGTDENKIRAAREILKGVLSDKIDLTGKMNVVYIDNQDKDL